MKLERIRFIYQSILFRVVLLLVVVLMPLVIVLIYNNYIARNTLLTQVEETHRNMLNSYLSQIDSQLNSSMAYTIDLALFQNETQALIDNKDESDLEVAKYTVYRNLSNRFIFNDMIDTFFVYVKDDDNFIVSSKYSIHNDDITALKNYIVDNLSGKNMKKSPIKASWRYTKIGDRNCLINLSYSNNGIIAGAYIDTEYLLEKFEKKKFTTSKLLLIPSQTLSNVNQKTDKNSILITVPSSVADIYMGERLQKNEVLQSLPFMQKYITLVTIFVILVVPVLLFFIKILVFDPLNNLKLAMRRVRIGDIDYRIKKKNSSYEFEFVNETFNEMMDNLRDLKIGVYEEKLKVQKSQLRNLQMQIKPHFLINSLNMIFNLITNNDINSAKQLIRYSADYFRYMAQVDNDFVKLNDETKHVRNYLEIQRIRYADQFTYLIEVNQLIEDISVPPMLIQNFVENSIKYAIEMSKAICITIQIEYLEIDYYPYVKLRITDTGDGYPEDILDRLNAGKKVKDSRGDHIGIYNSVQRLKILYEDKASWRFYNDNGAVSEIIIPAIFEKCEDDFDID